LKEIQQQQQQRITGIGHIVSDADNVVKECKKAFMAFVLRCKYKKLFNNLLFL
jgi:hypothetical protein